jgi:peptidoglycan-N-acetylglucosamine deacetylase
LGGRGLEGTRLPGPDFEKQVALTFDDGPHPSSRPAILRLLKEYDARATFFVLGRHAARYPDLIRKLVDSGQEVGITASPTCASPRGVLRPGLGNYSAPNWSLASGLPCSPAFPPPLQRLQPETACNFWPILGQRLVLWSVDAADWREPDPLAIAVKVLSQVRPGSIVILHDSDETGTADRQPTIEALGLILPALKARGYELCHGHRTHLFTARAGPGKGGKRPVNLRLLRFLQLFPYLSY